MGGGVGVAGYDRYVIVTGHGWRNGCGRMWEEKWVWPDVGGICMLSDMAGVWVWEEKCL